MTEVGVFAAVTATSCEIAAARAGDDLIAAPDVVMNRAFAVAAAPEVVWPWLVQLGKKRAGWYLPRSIERLVPKSRRALRRIEPRWQNLRVGAVIPDYGGRNATSEVALLQAPTVLVYRSRRGRMEIIWSITVTPVSAGSSDGRDRSRVHLRLSMASVRRRWLATTVGEFMDLVTIAGMAAGLAERLRPAVPPAHRPRSPGYL